MGRTIQLRVDESLSETLARIQKEVAGDMKKTYGLESITIHGTLASQILAAKMNGKRVLNFKIEKTALNKGILKILNWFVITG